MHFAHPVASRAARWQTDRMSADFHVVVAGAGVVGLAIARALAQSGREVLVLEAAERAGEGISSRNSGVIHAGMYYPVASLKARLCVRGRDLLYAYCADRGIAHRRCGKLIVAVNESELPALRALQERAGVNGAPVNWLESNELRALEPALGAVAALDSPSTGIIDVPEYVNALIGDLEQAGGRLLTRTPVSRVERRDGLYWVESEGGDGISCQSLVNAAGLGATELAARIEGMDAGLVPRLYYGQGHYYGLRGRAPFQRLIYPLPGPASLGVHLGLDLAGRCRFGPDMRWIARPDYNFDDSQRERFADAIRAWWPTLDTADLQPDFVGVRPKIHGPDQPAADFLIQDQSSHGLPGLVNLFGIESPGLTASMAIAEEVLARLAPGCTTD